MPRKPRIEYERGLFHIINRGINREILFKDDEDYKKFIEYLKITQELYPFICYSYVIMPNHFHILIERSDDSLSSILKSLLSRYAIYYNQKYNRNGHVFQGRFYSVICQKDEYLYELVRYIHLNPVRAGLVKRPENWQWSSLKAFIGKPCPVRVDTISILKYFNKDLRKAMDMFIEFMYDGVNAKLKFKVYPSTDLLVLGNDEFIRKLLKNTKEFRRKTIPELRITLKILCEILCDKYKITHFDITRRGGGRRVSRVRALFGYISNIYCRYSISEIAKFLNKDPSAVTHAITKIRKDKNSKNIIEVKKIVTKFKNSRPSLKNKKRIMRVYE